MRTVKVTLFCFMVCLCQTAYSTNILKNNQGTIPAISINNQSIIEGDSGDANIISLTVALSQPSDKLVTVRFVTSEFTAIAELDFITTGGVLAFKADETSKQLQFEIIGDDIEEVNEIFEIELFSPTNATIIVDSATVTIIDDDGTTSVPLLSNLSVLIFIILMFLIYLNVIKKHS